MMMRTIQNLSTKMLLNLPWETLEHILSFLDANDLGRLTCVCKYLHGSIKCESSSRLWKVHCKRVWLVDRLDADCPNWLGQWTKMLANYGQYRHCYADVKQAWNMIEDFLSLHSSSTDSARRLSNSLRGGISEEEISAVESELGLTFPNDYRCSLRIHDGQDLQYRGSFLGTVQFYSCHSTLYLYPLLVVKKCKDDRSRELWKSNSHYLLIGGDLSMTNGSNILLAKDTCAFTSPGQVMQAAKLNWNEIGIPVSVLGDFPNSHVIPDYSLGLIGESKNFKDWLMDCARALPNYPIVNNNSGSGVLRFYRQPDCIATTGHFTVRVGTALEPSLGLNGHSLPFLSHILQVLLKGGSYAYWITIEMDEDAPKEDTCILESRHWTIRYASGKEEVVDGEGVIGETPVFSPGHVHQYASCTSFIEEEWCTMEGHYNMRYLSSSRAAERFRIQIPKFHMPLPQVVWL